MSDFKPRSLKNTMNYLSKKYREKLDEFGLKPGQSFDGLKAEQRHELAQIQLLHDTIEAELLKHHQLLRGGKRNKRKTKRRMNKKRKTYKK
jgi:hypothetical protein